MRNKSLKIIAIVLFIIVLVMMTIVISIIKKDSSESSNKGNDKKIYRQIVSTDKENEDVNFQFYTCYKKDFIITKNSDGAADISCYVGNSTDNKYNNMYFELYIFDESDTKNLLYKSGIIPLGKYAESMEIDRCELDEGEYKGELVHIILNDNGKQLKTVSVATNIIVK